MMFPFAPIFAPITIVGIGMAAAGICIRAVKAFTRRVFS